MIIWEFYPQFQFFSFKPYFMLRLIIIVKTLFYRLSLKNKDYECSFVTFLWFEFTTTHEEHWDLKHFDHDIRKMEFFAIYELILLSFQGNIAILEVYFFFFVLLHYINA